MTQLHFNYKDLFRACRLGFSAKKIWMCFLGYLIGFAGYCIISYVAYLLAGWNIQEIWLEYRLLPFPQAYPWYSWLVWAVGVIYFLAVFLITGSAVSKVTYEHLRGDEFFEIKESFKYAFQNANALLLSPILPLLFVIALVICGLILSLIGAIPFFGEIFVGIMALPAFAVALFIVYLLIVFFFTLMLGPSIVGTTKNDTFDTLFEVFSCFNEQPWRLVVYGALLWVLSRAGAFILGLASAAAVKIGSVVVHVFAGAKIYDMLANGSHMLKINLPIWTPEIIRTFIERLLVYVRAGMIIEPSYYTWVNWSTDVGSILFGIAFYCIVLFVLSYAAATWFSGNVLIYSVLVKKKDDKNLLEKSEEERLETKSTTPTTPEPSKVETAKEEPEEPKK
ncbi:MAG: hypothetical protein OEZ20_00410 [candidate division WOR-3 bacterium]|nr:hypothetical protein [candidate division WOR-3 bacterium]